MNQIGELRPFPEHIPPFRSYEIWDGDQWVLCGYAGALSTPFPEGWIIPTPTLQKWIEMLRDQHES
jgi:hypothetical protein